MNRKILGILALVLLIGNASGLNSTIRDSCEGDEAPLISLNDTEGGHVAEPDFYGNQVCVNGLREPEIKTDCGDKVRMFSIFSREDSHLSEFDIYSYGVCAQNTRGYVNSTCSGSEEIVSVRFDNNTHAASPGHYPQGLCLKKINPTNLTIQVSGLSGSFYADENTINEGETLSFLEYPYIVAENNGFTRGILSYGDFVKLSRTSNSISLTQTTSTFLLPFYNADYRELEDEQQEVLDRSLLDSFSPSFSYLIPETPRIKVALRPEHKIRGFEDSESGIVEVSAQNLGLIGTDLVVEIKAD